MKGNIYGKNEGYKRKEVRKRQTTTASRRSWKSRLFVCQERSLVRTNKWKQIISWPHYEKESIASREDSMCTLYSWGGSLFLSLSFPLYPPSSLGLSRLPQGDSNEANECRTFINAGLGAHHVSFPFSLSTRFYDLMHIFRYNSPIAELTARFSEIDSYV